MKALTSLLTLTLLGTVALAEPIKPPLVPVLPKPPVLDPVVVKKTFHLNTQELAAEVDRLLATAKMRLHNHKVQGSYVQLNGLTFNFQIPRTTVDIDCGTFCPDLGDGHFYVNDVNLERADFRAISGGFELSLDLEDAGREVKGYHSLLGDDGMPDFQMDRPLLKLVSRPVLINRQLGLSFVNSNLTADIQSTGGCNIGGIDICNRIFGTNRKIEKSVEAAALNAMNGGMIQGALRFAIRQYLQSRGINGVITRVAIVGTDLQVTVQ